jgi:hypothetical protein
MDIPKFPCPSCGFIVFDEPTGSYDICPICGWEDDSVQLKYPALPMGANKGGLYFWQKENLIQIPPGILEYHGYFRDPDWRPLREEDLKIDPTQPVNGLDYFYSAAEDAPPYYWKKGL